MFYQVFFISYYSDKILMKRASKPLKKHSSFKYRCTDCASILPFICIANEIHHSILKFRILKQFLFLLIKLKNRIRML